MPIIRELNVDFPHNPYDVQTLFMEKVIDGINNSQNCVLESPTGTGKTLSLLCSMYDFRRQCESTNEIPSDLPFSSKIIFTSRTHSQLKQAMAELNCTSYKTMKSAILGSRCQLCINDEALATSENIHSMCKSLNKANKCEFYNRFKTLKMDENFMTTELSGNVMDIEDLVSLGKAKGFCPYFMSRHMAEGADVVFSPYNYIIDERIRTCNEARMLLNATVIMDEAHNIPEFCENIASIEFNSDDILAILDDVQRVIALIGFHEAASIIVLIEKIIDFLADIRRLWQCGAGLRKFKEILWIPFSDSGDAFVKDVKQHYRFGAKYIRSLGRTILNLCNVIPDGVLIFFPSYKVLELCKDSWQASGIWSQIHDIKPIIIEPRTKAEYLVAMENYYANVDDQRTNGAILIGVCRGKVAEGLDFADNYGRAVIITGIPNPPWKEPKIRMKMKYLDDIGSETRGKVWYNQQASRAVNQAVGRIIRHRNDFGAILLLDCRFVRHSGWSGWLQQHMNRCNTFKRFGSTNAGIAQFFERNESPPNAADREMDTTETPSAPVMSLIEYNLLYENEL
ncbi:regulator of telomere elongation helicase 1 homolog [Bradysia coprophila]|uniref:regulator of telomere elongation helicase 1 homolog n=1 Tax=Bradysia coprophila TaxID=38358 RepID=UPI00187DD434|nr:regulator of telomere elongation helicase 1 homolog [Bradysia coprophila]